LRRTANPKALALSLFLSAVLGGSDEMDEEEKLRVLKEIQLKYLD
jgi:hypothetical protein